MGPPTNVPSFGYVEGGNPMIPRVESRNNVGLENQNQQKG